MKNLKIFTEDVEDNCMKQIESIARNPIFKNNEIRIMPDCHAGKGCCVGLTMEVKDKIVPDLLGVDLSCAVAYYPLNIYPDKYNLKDLDEFIHKNIPCGREVNSISLAPFMPIYGLSFKPKNRDRLHCSIGTLGGGNHFIAIEVSEETGIPYLVVHTGSRNLGVQVNKHHQKIAEKRKGNNLRAEVIELYKRNGLEYLINELNFPKEEAYLSGKEKEDYLKDCEICKQFATANRLAIVLFILNFVGIRFDPTKYNETVHNYCDGKFLRKGAISAKKGEQVIIPINMAEGSVLGVGKGNPDWNYSAPHGAGRDMSRTQAKKELSLDTMKKDMEGIYSTCINESTLDEAPNAYKLFDESLLKDTVTITDHLKPIYNFKAGE